MIAIIGSIRNLLWLFGALLVLAVSTIAVAEETTACGDPADPSQYGSAVAQVGVGVNKFYCLCQSNEWGMQSFRINERNRTAKTCNADPSCSFQQFSLDAKGKVPPQPFGSALTNRLLDRLKESAKQCQCSTHGCPSTKYESCVSMFNLESGPPRCQRIEVAKGEKGFLFSVEGTTGCRCVPNSLNPFRELYELVLGQIPSTQCL